MFRFARKFVFGSTAVLATGTVVSIFAVRKFVTVPKIEWGTESTCVHVQHPKADFYIIGGAHFGEESGKQVQTKLNEIKPDAVMIELCAYRFQFAERIMNATSLISTKQSLAWREKMKQFNLRPWNETQRGLLPPILINNNDEETKETMVENWRAINSLNYFQGLDMAAAIQYCFHKNCPLFLGDRSYKETQWDFEETRTVFPDNDDAEFEDPKMSAYFQQNIISLIIHYAGTKEQRYQFYENLRHLEFVTKMNEHERQYQPSSHKVIITDRNLYMVENLLDIAERLPHQSARPKIVAIVGLAHLPGIVEELGKK